MKVNYFYAIAALGMMASCSNPDYFNTEEGSEYREYNVQKTKAEYEKNFVANFGEINPNQPWDLSTVSLSTRAAAAESMEIGWDEATTEYVENIVESDVNSDSFDSSKNGPCDFNDSKKYLSEDGKKHLEFGVLDYTIQTTGDYLLLSAAWHSICEPGYVLVVDGYNPVSGKVSRHIFTQEDIKELNP
ncbi:MAG: hypothetical protein HUJ99_01795, partial [Bacteroidaceae bacterium]|nr:hypothetical protein [Bacteroidaceae bacterium]